MRKLFYAALMAGFFSCALPLMAQQVCPGLSYVANTPEDELMQEVNGAEKPEEQIAALDKFAQAHTDSKFMPCVYEYYTMVYLKLNNFDKVIEYGEKGIATDHRDMNLIINLAKAYVASGKSSDSVLDAVVKAPDQIKAETSPLKPSNISDAEWQKTQQELADQAKDEGAYMTYAFFQLLPRVPDGKKRVEALDGFLKAYPDVESKNTGQINFAYFIAYKMANQPDQAREYGEKTIATDPNNVAALNLMAYDYGIGKASPDQKATDYAKKALDLAQAMKKPEGVPDDQFKLEQNGQLGMAHLTLGYVAFTKIGKSKKAGPAIDELKVAADLLEGNPELQGQALYYLGYAYEANYPANHQGAFEALTHASNLQTSWRGPAQDLLEKVKRAMK
jgi:tetratricopeptide (TPR) repeat protein